MQNYGEKIHFEEDSAKKPKSLTTKEKAKL